MANNYQFQISKKNFSIGQWSISLFFALKILVFAAAYPLFYTVDEFANFDTARKQQRDLWGSNETALFDSTSIEIYKEVQTPEYWLPSSNHKITDFQTDDQLYSKRNQQVHSSPLYFTTYGLVYNILPSSWSVSTRVYSLRFLNCIPAFFLVWFVISAGSILFSRALSGLSFGVLFLAIPQSVFYFINLDILSALVCVMAFFFGLKFVREASWRNVILFSAFCALAILIKASGLVLVLSAFAFLALVLWRQQKIAPRKLLVAFICTVLLLIPVILKRVSEGIGAFATEQKIEILGWTEKPLLEMMPHMIFTGRGLGLFCTGNMRTWWTGESIWHGETLYPEKVHDYFLGLTILILVIFLFRTIYYWKTQAVLQQARLASWICFAGYFLLFAFLSMRYDFGACVYPSRQFPIFVSGRLMLGMLFPFVFVMFDMQKTFFKKDLRVFVFSALLAVIHVGLEIYFTGDIFTSTANFFH